MQKIILLATASVAAISIGVALPSSNAQQIPVSTLSVASEPEPTLVPAFNVPDSVEYPTESPVEPAPVVTETPVEPIPVDIVEPVVDVTDEPTVEPTDDGEVYVEPEPEQVYDPAVELEASDNSCADTVMGTFSNPTDKVADLTTYFNDQHIFLWVTDKSAQVEVLKVQPGETVTVHSANVPKHMVSPQAMFGYTAVGTSEVDDECNAHLDLTEPS